MLTQKYVNEISYEIVGCAIEVHKNLGPGLLESIYESCMIYELNNAGLNVKSQVPIPLFYKNIELGTNLKLDLLVNDIVIVELKSVENVIPLYSAQLLTYLNMTGKPKGLLINFNCENITKHLVPLVTKQFSDLPIE